MTVDELPDELSACVVTSKSFDWMPLKALVIKDELVLPMRTVVLKRSIWGQDIEPVSYIKHFWSVSADHPKILTKFLLTFIGSLNTVQITASLHAGVVKEPR